MAAPRRPPQEGEGGGGRARHADAGDSHPRWHRHRHGHGQGWLAATGLRAVHRRRCKPLTVGVRRWASWPRPTETNSPAALPSFFGTASPSTRDTRTSRSRCGSGGPLSRCTAPLQPPPPPRTVADAAAVQPQPAAPPAKTATTWRQHRVERRGRRGVRVESRRSKRSEGAAAEGTCNGVAAAPPRVALATVAWPIESCSIDMGSASSSAALSCSTSALSRIAALASGDVGASAAALDSSCNNEMPEVSEVAGPLLLCEAWEFGNRSGDPSVSHASVPASG